jgi:serine protease Do
MFIAVLRPTTTFFSMTFRHSIRVSFSASLLASWLLFSGSVAFSQNGLMSPLGLPDESSVAKPATREELKEIQSKVQAVYQKNLPATVSIVSNDPKTPGSGSGVIVNKEGLILTAAHVTQATGKDITIIFPDGKRVKGKSLGANRGTDAGLAKIEEKGEWPCVEMGDSNGLNVGDWLVSMGHPGGFDRMRKPPVRLGRLWDRDLEGAIITDCSLIGGDSGGPLFDLAGRVVGIHSSIHANLRHNRHVALDHFKGDMEAMLEGKDWGVPRQNGADRKRPKLGMVLDRQAQTGGAVIKEVAADSAAAKAGFQAGDVIQKLNAAEINNTWGIMRELSDCKAGEYAKFELKRGAEVVNVRFRLLDAKGEKEQTAEAAPKAKGKAKRGAEPDLGAPEMAERPRLGLGLEKREGGKGLRVTSVEEKGLGEAAGLKVGDFLLKIESQELVELEDALKAMNGLQGAKFINLTFERDGKKLEATQPLDVSRF